MKDQKETLQKSELLKGLLAVLPKKKKHRTFCGSRPEWYDKINMGECDCNAPAHNRCLSEVRTRLEAWVGGLELDWKEVSKIVSLLTQDEAIEYRNGLTRCNVPLEKSHRALATIHDFIVSRTITTKIADALASKGSLLIKVKGEMK